MLPLQTIPWIAFVANRVRRPIRSLFAAYIDKIVRLSIAIGMAAMLIALMVMIGFQKEIKKKITSFAGNFELTKYSSSQNLYELPPLPAAQISSLIANCPDFIESIKPFIQKVMLIHTKKSVEGILCKGLDPIQADQNLSDYLIAGRLPDISKSTYQNELCISNYLAEKLSIKLGQTVVIHTVYPIVRYRKLKVVGIYRTYLNDIDQHIAFGDMRLIQRLNNWSSDMVSGYTIFLKENIVPVQSMQDSILGLLNYDLRLVTTQRKFGRFYDWLAIIQKNTSMLIFFILLVAACTMVATVMIQLMERSYMIGLLKALGGYDWQINGIVLYNSLRTLCSGMLYGNLVGIGCCLLQDRYKWVTLEPALYYMRYVPIYMNWQIVLYLNCLIFSILAVALYVAIKLIKKKKLTEALQEG